jgi:hypothetical protein
MKIKTAHLLKKWIWRGDTVASCIDVNPCFNASRIAISKYSTIWASEGSGMGMRSSALSMNIPFQTHLSSKNQVKRGRDKTCGIPNPITHDIPTINSLRQGAH